MNVTVPPNDSIKDPLTLVAENQPKLRSEGPGEVTLWLSVACGDVVLAPADALEGNCCESLQASDMGHEKVTTPYNMALSYPIRYLLSCRDQQSGQWGYPRPATVILRTMISTLWYNSPIKTPVFSDGSLLVGLYHKRTYGLREPHIGHSIYRGTSSADFSGHEHAIEGRVGWVPNTEGHRVCRAVMPTRWPAGTLCQRLIQAGRLWARIFLISPHLL